MTILLALVLVLGMTVSAFAGTITAPEEVFTGSDFTVSIVSDTGAGDTAVVVWTVNGTTYTTDATLNDDGKWVSELEILDADGESYDIDAVIKKYKGNGTLHSNEDSDSVTVEVVEPTPVEPPTMVGFSIVDWDTQKQGKSSFQQLVIDQIRVEFSDGSYQLVDVDFVVGGIKSLEQSRNFDLEYEGISLQFNVLQLPPQ